MANKKKYYQLDDVGVLGVVERRSDIAIKRDADLTSAFIKKYRAGAISVAKESAVVVNPKREMAVKTASHTTIAFSSRKKQHAHK